MSDQPDDLVLQHLRLIRAELRDVRTLTLRLADQGRQLDQRISHVDQRISQVDQPIDMLKDDLELIIRTELMGQLGHFETVMGTQLDTLSTRVAALERLGPGR